MLELPAITNQEEIDAFYRNLSANVKKIRLQKGMSQLEVALLIGHKAQGFYANMENYAHGKHFNLVHLFKLSKLFGVDIAEFFKKHTP